MENREFTKEQAEEIQELIRQIEVIEERNKHLLKMIRRKNRDTFKNVKIMLVSSVITASASLFLLGVAVGRCLPF